MSIIQVLTVVSNLAIGLWSSPAPPTAVADNPSFANLPTRPVAAHVVVAGTQADEITKETCASCHEEQVASFDRSEHARAMPAGR